MSDSKTEKRPKPLQEIKKIEDEVKLLLSVLRDKSLLARLRDCADGLGSLVYFMGKGDYAAIYEPGWVKNRSHLYPSLLEMMSWSLASESDKAIASKICTLLLDAFNEKQ